MKKIKFLATLSVFSLFGAAPLMLTAKAANAEGVTLSGIELEDAYSLGDKVYIPKDATLIDGEKTVKVVSSYLTYPNGSNVSSRSYTLDAFGKYKLVLNGEDGVTYAKEFTVWQDVYAFGGSKSSIDYGKLNKSFNENGYAEGLRLELAEGDTFTYSKPIDLSKSTYQKLIYWNLTDYSNNPIAHSMTVRITDAYDPNNYFTITNSRGTYFYENYVSAAYNGGRAVGLSKDDSGSIVIGGTTYRVSSTGGTTLSANNPTSKAYNNLSYFLDTSNPSNYRIYASTDAASDYALITEFNNSSAYNTTFHGFKTGLVYLSFTASGFSGIDKAPIEIGEIAGIKGSDLNPMDYYKDTINPIVEVSSKKKAKVKGGVEIAIPEAKAYDETGLKGEVVSSVWFGYDSSSRKMISTKNGRFSPNELGIYTIIYKATDVYQNVTEERVDLYVSDFGEKGIDFAVKPLKDVKAGSTVIFDNYEATSLNDDCVTEIELLFPNGEKETIEGGSSLMLPYSGTYKATYRYHDGFYSGFSEYSFDVIETTKATFLEKHVSLPHYFMKGASYSIDVPASYTYGPKGETKDDVDCYVKFDGGSYVSADHKDVTITGSESVQLKFNPKSNPDDVIETEAIAIVDAGFDPSAKRVDLTKYFVGDFIGRNSLTSDGKDADYVTYLADKSGSTKMEFINKLLLSSFVFNFSAENVSKVRLNLVSFYDSSKKVEIVFEGGVVSVNGRSNPVTKRFDNEMVSVLYSASTNKLDVAGASFEVPNDFEKDSLLLEVEVEGATRGSSAINVSKIGNQVFKSNSTRDRVQPMVSVDFPESVAHVGDTVEIVKPNVADVLTPVSDKNILLSVIKNAGGSVTDMVDKNSKEVIKNVNDFSKNYQIELNAYGAYVITYDIKDGMGNSIYGGLKGMVSVLDMDAPTIVTKIDSYTIRANEESDLPHIEATDNMTASDKLEIWYLIYDSKNRLTAQIPDGDKVNIKEKGRYTVYVTVQDEEGNVAYADYILIVE